MKINRVNVVVHTSNNKHVKYLYNHCLDLMNKYKFGGEFRNETIKMSSAPDSILKELKDLKIDFERG